MKVIITGSTGMAGEGVLLECLQNENVSSVLSISRKPCGIEHARLKELIVPDFMKLQEFETEVAGYDACFYCAGISSVGMKETRYHRITYDTTIAFASVLSKVNPNMVFCYITGSGTDSTERGRIMWARVKVKTENALMKKPFSSRRHAARCGSKKCYKALCCYCKADKVLRTLRRAYPARTR